MGINAGDVDSANLANTTANGDDNNGTDDEDGVTFGTLPQAGTGTITVGGVSVVVDDTDAASSDALANKIQQTLSNSSSFNFNETSLCTKGNNRINSSRWNQTEENLSNSKP